MRLLYDYHIIVLVVLIKKNIWLTNNIFSGTKQWMDTWRWVGGYIESKLKEAGGGHVDCESFSIFYLFIYFSLMWNLNECDVENHYMSTMMWQSHHQFFNG